MKILTFAATIVILTSAANAQQQTPSVETECSTALSIVQLEPLTEEERIVLEQLDQIENRAEIVAQVGAEAQVSLDAFGGCGAQQFLLTIPTTD